MPVVAQPTLIPRHLRGPHGSGGVFCWMRNRRAPLRGILLERQIVSGFGCNIGAAVYERCVL
jgi:hypothetical protein